MQATPEAGASECFQNHHDGAFAQTLQIVGKPEAVNQMLVNVRDRYRVPSAHGQHQITSIAAQLPSFLSLAYSGNETVTLVPATENAEQNQRDLGTFSGKGRRIREGSEMQSAPSRSAPSPLHR